MATRRIAERVDVSRMAIWRALRAEDELEGSAQACEKGTSESTFPCHVHVSLADPTGFGLSATTQRDTSIFCLNPSLRESRMSRCCQLARSLAYGSAVWASWLARRAPPGS